MCECKQNQCACECDKPRKNTKEEAVAVLQAWYDDKPLEFRHLNSNRDWDVRGEAGIWERDPPDFSVSQYRVKQEPRVIFSIFLKQGDDYVYSHSYSDKKRSEQSISNLMHKNPVILEMIQKL